MGFVNCTDNAAYEFGWGLKEGGDGEGTQHLVFSPFLNPAILLSGM